MKKLFNDIFAWLIFAIAILIAGIQVIRINKPEGGWLIFFIVTAIFIVYCLFVRAKRIYRDYKKGEYKD